MINSTFSLWNRLQQLESLFPDVKLSKTFFIAEANMRLLTTQNIFELIIILCRISPKKSLKKLQKLVSFLIGFFLLVNLSTLDGSRQCQ